MPVVEEAVLETAVEAVLGTVAVVEAAVEWAVLEDADVE